jgi:ABC-type glycerol-3-phosphate transport system substrate-binding protein
MNMKKKISRLISLVMALLVLAAISASCAGGESKNNETTVSVSGPDNTAAGTNGETTRLYPEFPEKNYGGSVFNILRYDSETANGWTGIPNDIMIAETNGEILNDSVYSRNRSVEDRFNVKITTTEHGSGLSSLLQTSVLAGDNLYDMVDQCLNEVSRLFNMGLITSFDEINVDLGMPWFDQSSIKSFTISGKIFAAVSDVTYIDKLSTVVAFYNKSLAEKIGIADLYKTALDGDWTLDKMLSYSSAVTADLNSDGKMDQNDAYCISCQNDGSYFFLHSAGILVAENDGTNITYTLNSEKAISALENIFKIMNDTSIYFNRQLYGMQPAEVAAMFAKEQALFMIRPLQSLYDLRSLDASFGIIPVPKYYADQEKYYVPINTYGATIICIPKGAPDYEKTSLVFEALAAESHYRVMPSFYNVVLGTKLVNDPEASKVLDLVFANRVYDLGMIWNFGSIRGAIVVSNMVSVASNLKRFEKLVQSAIDTLYSDVAKLETDK